jgi:hypothetical protein
VAHLRDSVIVAKILSRFASFSFLSRFMPGNVEIHLLAVLTDAADLVDHLGAGFNFVADVGRSRHPGRGGAFAGFGHGLSA